MKEHDIIRAAMWEKRYTQKSLAEKIGYKHQSNIGILLSGKSMRVDSFVKLLDAMGYDVVVMDRESRKQWTVTEE